jgi:VanZ family protein
MIVAAYWMAGFYPFDLDLPWFQDNGLIRQPDGSLEFISAGIGRTAAAPAWVGAAIQQGSFAISVRACPHHAVQTGPARIVTISKDPWLQNVTIAQNGHDLEVRLRRSGSDLSGMPPYVVPNTFRDLSCRSIDLRVEPLKVMIYVDSVEMVIGPLESQSLDTWDRGFRLAVGNELTNNRAWLGSIKVLRAGAPSYTVDYLVPHSLVLPERLWHVPGRLTTVVENSPWTTNRDDAVLNVLGFVPLPLLLAATAFPRTRGLIILFAAILVSLSMEIGQTLFAHRVPSLADLALNTVGAALGVLLLKFGAPVRMVR